ncbi:MAG: cytoplasmic protein [Rhizobiaceae bacterium]
MRDAAREQIERNDTRRRSAARRVAMRLLVGVDIEDIDGLAADGRGQLLLRVERLIERERLKGAQRHWSYDLNRHIALADAARYLREGANADGRPGEAPPVA